MNKEKETERKRKQKGKRKEKRKKKQVKKKRKKECEPWYTNLRPEAHMCHVSSWEAGPQSSY